MVKLSVTAFLLAFIASTGIAQADGHAALEEENAKLQQQLEKANKDKAFLGLRLRRVIANSEGNSNEIASLQQQLEKANKDKGFLGLRLRRVIANSQSSDDELAKANEDRNTLRNRLRRAIAHSKSTKSDLSAKLASANTGRDYLRDRLRNAIANAKSTKSDLSAQLASANTGRDYLRDRLSSTLASQKATKSNLASANKDRSIMRESLSRAITHGTSTRNEFNAQLARANEDRNTLRNRLRRAIANAKSTKAELKQQLASDANWACGVGTSLQSSIGGVQGTEVSTDSASRVNVQVGNNGLFKSGGTALSDNGKALLSQIAEQLTQQDAMVTVIGHTDNVPVGESSLFGSNEELSLSRALSTLRYLRKQGVSVEQLSAAGYGADYPIASNDTAEGRQRNRRVEIVLNTK